jgi:predicted negative regulator of RcsB-dependent stress response
MEANVAKKQKRMSLKELKSPDEIDVKLQEFWQRLMRHRKVLLAGCAAILVLGAGTSLFSSMSEEASDAQAQALTTALAPLTAPVGADAEANIPENSRVDVETYADNAAAVAEAAKRLDAYSQEFNDSEVGDLYRAMVALAAGDGAKATSGLETWLAAHPDTSLKMPLTDALARAKAVDGDVDGASAAYQTIADSSNGMAKALALMAIGDLNNPLAVANGDVAKARTSYEQALALMGGGSEADSDDPLAAYSKSYLEADLTAKLALLD